MNVPKLRKLDDVLPEVSKSLEILDNVLEEFEEEYEQMNLTATTSSRILDDIPPEVSKSLEVLDNVLEEFELGQKQYEHLKRNSTTNTLRRHEDIRRSLEVLDNVLAEFDDCIDTWESPTLHRKEFDSSPNSTKDIEETKWSGNYSCNLVQTQDHIIFRKQLKDGSTSHDSADVIQDQATISPPPVPKRNPNTRLSEKIETNFTFPTDNISLDSYDSFRLDSIEENCGFLSSPEHVQRPIRPLSPEKNDDSGVFHSLPDHCVGCGLSLSPNFRMDTVSNSSNESSPFALRKKAFEDRISETSSAKGSPLLQRPSFRLKKRPNHVESKSETSLGPAFENIVSTMSAELDSPNCDERIRQLHVKFKRVRELLSQNKIKLDGKPPSFAPPPPPVTHQSSSGFDVNLPQEGSQNDFQENNLDPNITNTTPYDGDPSQNYDDFDPTASDTDLNSLDNSCTQNSNTSKLCNRCSSSLSSGLDGVLNPLPVEALVRPQFILSYSLEEDMPPGVKEIRQTSTPKSDASSPSFLKTKESGLLSTFSNSASSLGYASSQSELELNSLPEIPNKVPVSSFKSVTLPNGLDRSAFYSSSPPSNSNFLRRYNSNSPKDHNSNKVHNTKSTRHSSSDPLDWRSSSTPPELEKPKKKESPFHFRGFSRKQKKDKK